MQLKAEASQLRERILHNFATTKWVQRVLESADGMKTKWTTLQKSVAIKSFSFVVVVVQNGERFQ